MMPNAQTHLPPGAGARHERTLEAVSCRARLCQNPVFGACGLCKPLILFDRIFEKSTFHTVWCLVRCGAYRTPRLYEVPSAASRSCIIFSATPLAEAGFWPVTR